MRAMVRTWSALPCALLLSGCEAPGEEAAQDGASEVAASPAVCPADIQDFTLPPGFCAVVVHEGVSDARDLVVTSEGDIYVARRQRPQGPGGNGIVALRDTTGDGRADVMEEFGDLRGNGITVLDGHLYFSTDTSVVRYRLPTGGGLPAGPPEVVVRDFLAQQSHALKSLAHDDSGTLWVGVGAPSNNCGGPTDRQPGARGLDPCPELERQAGVWRFDASRLNQRQVDGERWASGIRNPLALAYNPLDGQVWTVQHGRDQLDLVSSGEFSAEENALRPAEELLRLTRGSTFSWPYCFYDLQTESRMVAPEYAGTGWADRCDEFPEPVATFGAHWAPNGLVFYTGEQFPERYRGGAFVAFHGSWNRAPLPQDGYNVVFQPISGANAGGESEVFAAGFPGEDSIASPGSARFRPTGLAVGPDGALYISDSVEGRIWRVTYTGQ
jgi:glucose/arabinose dehydrogenase